MDHQASDRSNWATWTDAEWDERMEELKDAGGFEAFMRWSACKSARDLLVRLSGRDMARKEAIDGVFREPLKRFRDAVVKARPVGDGEAREKMACRMTRNQLAELGKEMTPDELMGEVDDFMRAASDKLEAAGIPVPEDHLARQDMIAHMFVIGIAALARGGGL